MDKLIRFDVPYNADAEIVKSGNTYSVELDLASMNEKRMRERMKSYEGCPHDVLWICPTKHRVSVLKKVAQDFQTEFWFTTYPELLVGDVLWEDKQGTRTSMT